MAKVYPIYARTIAPLVNLIVKKIDGIENIPKEGPYILAANHTSYIDPFLITHSLVPKINRKVHYLSKVNLVYKLCGKWITEKWAGIIPITEITKKKELALKMALKILKNNGIIGMHPEGRRSRTGEFNYGKTGVARLALWSRAPVIPIGILGTFEILPAGRTIPRAKRATIKIGKPLYFEKDYNKKVTKKRLVDVTTKIMQGIGKLTSKRYDPNKFLSLNLKK